MDEINNKDFEIDVNEAIIYLRQKISDLEYELMLKDLYIKKMENNYRNDSANT